MNKTTIATISGSILAIIIAVVSLNHAYNVPAPKLGNVVQQDLIQDPYGQTIGPGNTFDNFQPLVIGYGQNQAGVCNNTGTNWIVRAYAGELVGTSSTAVANGAYNLYVGTSTTATVTDATTTMSKYTLIDGSKTFIGTTTLVTTLVPNSDVLGGANGMGNINVPTGTCINSALEASTSVSNTSATSTTRGFWVNGFIEYTSRGNQ